MPPSLLYVTTPFQGTLDKAAVAFCARKVSAVSGDMRKALDICRRSIEVTQMAQQKDHILRKGSMSSLQVLVAPPSQVSH